MALNRIYLRCKKCGSTLFLGKTFGEGYYWCKYDDKRSLEERLNTFFDDHDICGETCFEIEYEDTEGEA